jgi:hypothetical protein
MKTLMRKELLIGLVAVSLVFGMMGSASAVMIFQDDFTRVGTYPQNNIGNGWIETENSKNDIRVKLFGGEPRLRIRDTNASVEQQVSTVGYTNISLTFDWRGNNNAESGDSLGFTWFDGSNVHDPFVLLNLANHSLTNFSFNLPAAASNKPGFSFTLFTQVNAANEAARIDNVILAGVYSGGPGGEPVPEPATCALFGMGLVGLAGAAARRKFKKEKRQ